MKKSPVLMLLFFLVSCDAAETGKNTSSPNQSNGSVSTNSTFNLTQVADGFFVHQGVNVDIEDKDRADIANIGFIIGDECVAVIDTGGSIVIGEKLRAAVKEKTENPICYVINSHVHFDHVLGNAAFKQDQPKFIGHVNLADAIEQNREFFTENFSAAEVISPTVLVEDTMEIDLGNRILVLTAIQKAHTVTDLTVLDKKTNVLWLADLLFMKRVPILDGSLKGWSALMEDLHDHNYAGVVPGHGPVSSPWPVAMQAQQDYFDVLIDETRKAIANGVSLEEAVRTVGQSEKDKWELFDSGNQRTVNRVYRELEWE